MKKVLEDINKRKSKSPIITSYNSSEDELNNDLDDSYLHDNENQSYLIPN